MSLACEHCHDKPIPAFDVRTRAPGRRRRSKCRHCELLLCSECFYKTICGKHGFHEL